MFRPKNPVTNIWIYRNALYIWMICSIGLSSMIPGRWPKSLSSYWNEYLWFSHSVITRSDCIPYTADWNRNLRRYPNDPPMVCSSILEGTCGSTTSLSSSTVNRREQSERRIEASTSLRCRSVSVFVVTNASFLPFLIGVLEMTCWVGINSA